MYDAEDDDEVVEEGASVYILKYLWNLRMEDDKTNRWLLPQMMCRAVGAGGELE